MADSEKNIIIKINEIIDEFKTENNIKKIIGYWNISLLSVICDINNEIQTYDYLDLSNAIKKLILQIDNLDNSYEINRCIYGYLGESYYLSYSRFSYEILDEIVSLFLIRFIGERHLNESIKDIQNILDKYTYDYLQTFSRLLNNRLSNYI